MTNNYNLNDYNICVVGLGYVGLPLLLLLSDHFDVAGLDKSTSLIRSLRDGVDRTSEADISRLQRIDKEIFTQNWGDVSNCNVYICTLPTPVTIDKEPDVSALVDFCNDVGSVLKVEDTIVFESTVYPGVTEEVCIPILEKVSGLKAGQHFSVGYSPERVSPGDTSTALSKVTKIVSGLDLETTKFLSWMYGLIIEAGVYEAKNIKVAEASKVLENTQRDVNIALMNEITQLFHHLEIDTWDVLEAASTKWNFHKYHPGLVGGHCIGIDPYYLVFKAQMSDAKADLVVQARLVNEQLVDFIVKEILKVVALNTTPISEMKILIFGLTFKADVADLRNSKIFDIIKELSELKSTVDVTEPRLHDQNCNLDGVNQLIALDELEINKYDILIYAVNHKDFAPLRKRLDVVDVKKTKIFDLTGTLENYSWRI